MIAKILLGLLLSASACSNAIGQIELLSFKQDLNPHHAKLKIAIKPQGTNVETAIDLDYAGYCGTKLKNGEEKVMLSNKQGSIVAFNFWGGTKINDSVAMALLPSGKFMYFSNLNHAVSQEVEKFRKGIEESSFRVVDVAGDGIRLEYSEHSAQGSLFQVVAHILRDGSLQIRGEDIKDL